MSVATQGVRVARTISVDDLDFEYAAGLLDQQDTWIGAQPVKPSTGSRRAKHTDIACMRVLYADFDRKDSTDVSQIDSAISRLSLVLGVEPISVVDSGGGLHPRWKLEKPVTPEDAKGVLNRWKLTVLRVAEESGFKADSVFDLPRVLRLPGTVNEKYGHRPQVTITARPFATVPTSAVWSKLDTARSGKSPLAEEAPTVDDEKFRETLREALQAPQIERPQLKQTLSERYVNAEVGKDMTRLRALSRDGWEGEPWHNTTRDVAFRLAKIAVSPETKYTASELWDMFREAAPQDAEGFDEERIEQYWESGVERAQEDLAGGDTYELIGSGDELFAEDMDDLLEGARKSREPKLDIGWDDFESSVAAEPAPEDFGSAEERYVALATPLIPGFGGVAALRTLDIDTVRETTLQRIDATAEDVSDLHYEHVEYVHPHCPRCFPDTWRGQLARWFLRGGSDPLSIRPPAGGLAPGEGFYDFVDLLDEDGPRMMIEGYLPDRSVGILRGQGRAGKTFVAVDMAMSVLCEDDVWQEPLSAEDADWGEVRVGGGVLFLAGESHLGVRDRFAALARRDGVDPRMLSGKLTIQPRVPDFFNGDGHLEALLEFLRERGDIRLVIIDTLQKAAAGAEQNSASDMAKVNLNFARVRDAMGGGSVMVIAHTGHADDRSRGSSAIEDDADFVMHVKDKGEGLRRLSVEKMRDGSMGPEFDFILTPEGNSVVVAPAELAPAKGAGMESQKAIAKAMYEIHSSSTWDGDMTVNDIASQTDDDTTKKTIRRALIALKSEQRVILSSEKPQRYRMTQQGKIWTEAQGLGVFMR